MAEGLGIQHLFAASYNGADFPVKVLALSHPYTENKILPPYIVILIKKHVKTKLTFGGIFCVVSCPNRYV